jgi:hypothetical protein
MNYAMFKKVVREKGWTLPLLRSENAPPTGELLDFMTGIGLYRYESFVLRYERECPPAFVLTKKS